MMLWSDGAASMSSMRPPMLAGPIERKRYADSSGSSDWLIVAAGGAGVCCPCDATEAKRSGSATIGMEARSRRCSVIKPRLSAVGRSRASRGFQVLVEPRKLVEHPMDDVVVAGDAVRLPRVLDH